MEGNKLRAVAFAPSHDKSSYRHLAFAWFPYDDNAVSQDLESGSKIVLLIKWVNIFLAEPD